MSKYNEVMEKIVVSKDARERILQNIENELKDEKGISEATDFEDKSVKKFSSSKFYKFRKYAGIAAALIILIVGVYAVNKVLPFGSQNSSTSMMTETSGSTIEESATSVYESATETAADTSGTDNNTYTAGTEKSVGSGKNQSVSVSQQEYADLSSLSKAAGTTFKEIDYLESFSSSTKYYLYDEKVALIAYDVAGNLVTVKEMSTTKGSSLPADISADTDNLTSTSSLTVGNTTITLRGTDDTYTIAQWTDDTITYELESTESLTYDDMRELMSTIVN